MYWDELPKIAKKRFTGGFISCIVVLLFAGVLAATGIIGRRLFYLFIVADFIAFFGFVKQTEQYRKEARAKENADAIAAAVSSLGDKDAKHFCSSCGHALPVGISFCPYCGNKIK